MKPIRCPHCGAFDGYWHRQPVRGVERALVGPDGETQSVRLERAHYGAEPKTVVCAACRKRAPNPNLSTD